MEWGVMSNLIQYLIPIHVGWWYDRWGGGGGGWLALEWGVKSNQIQYLIPIHVGFWYDSGRGDLGLGVGSAVKPNPIPNFNKCRVVV